MKSSRMPRSGRIKVTADTMAQKVAPGVTDLKQVQPIKTEVAHDRVRATRKLARATCGASW